MKKINFRIISLLLAFLMMSSCIGYFAGCTGSPEETTAPATEESEQPPEQTETEVFEDVLKSAMSNYVLVRPEKVSKDLNEEFKNIYQALKAEYDIEYKDDFYREDVPLYRMGEYEILLGATNRPESQSFLDSLKYNDYGYALIGKKIVIAGHTDAGTTYAVRKFVNDVINKKDGDADVFYKSEYNYVNRAKYSVADLSIGDVPISKFRIVYSSNNTRSEQSAADIVFDTIAKLSGDVLDIVSDRTERGDWQHEIIIGATNRNTEAEISSFAAELGETESIILFNGTNVNIYGASATAVLVATNKLRAMFEGKSGDKISVALDAKTVCKYDDSILKAMSFNVWVSGKTTERNERVVTMVKNYLPDTVGFQEVDSVWLSTLRAGLKDIYAYVGEGRNGGTAGEYNPIFYKKDLFNLLDSGTKWLSATPDKVSKFDESSLNRIYTYALLERKSDGTKIMIVNTHFDHKSSAAREKQAKVLVDYIKTITDYPVILTGDFNCVDTSTEYSTIVKNGVVNSYSLADKKINNAPTFTNYGSSSKIIDFIFVTPKSVAVTSYGVCNETINGDYPSDHHPVIIEYTVLN